MSIKLSTKARLLAFFCCLYCSVLTGQAELAGRVADAAGEYVASASIVARIDSAGSPVAFGISDENGRYALRIPEATTADSLWVAIRHLAYAPQQRRVRNATQTLDWVLTTAAYALPELSVRQDPVIRRGDTLVFDVNQLREDGDQSIEALLARIPGVDVGENGRITYQGLPISRFYIEGLDLLGGSYALATRNLAIDAIRDIEILENHQPIRALDSLITPPNAAINLRLKSFIAFTGKGEIGGGAAPGLYQVLGTLFGFQRQRQLAALAGGSNTGQRKRYDFVDLYRQNTIEEILVTATQPHQPFRVDDRNGLRNQEYTGGLKWLEKTGKKGEIKLGLMGSRDQVRLDGVQELSLRNQDTTFRFRDVLAAQEGVRALTGQLAYELNVPSLYVQTVVDGDLEEAPTRANNRINGRAVFEQLADRKLSLGAKLKTILRRGDRAYELRSSINYLDRRYNLLVFPATLTAPELREPFSGDADQSLQLRQWKSNTYSGLAYRKGKLRGNVRFGLESLTQELDSDLSDGRTSFGTAFQNAYRQSRWSPYLRPNWIRKGKESEWHLGLPLWLDLVRQEDVLRGERLREIRPVFQPSLSFTYRKRRNRTFSATYQYYYDYARDALRYQGYLLRKNRFLDRNAFALNQRVQHELRLWYYGTESRQGNSFNASASAAITRQDLLTTTSFDANGQAKLLFAQRNTRQQLTAAYRREARIAWLGDMQLNLNVQGSFLVTPVVLNETELSVNTTYATLELAATYVFGMSVLKLEPFVQYQNNTISAAAVWQPGLKGEYYHRIGGKGGAARLNTNYFATRIGTRREDNLLLNASYETPLPWGDIDLRLEINNLLNTGSFLNFSQSIASETLSRFSLRPRQFVLVLRREF